MSHTSAKAAREEGVRGLEGQALVRKGGAMQERGPPTRKESGHGEPRRDGAAEHLGVTPLHSSGQCALGQAQASFVLENTLEPRG